MTKWDVILRRKEHSGGRQGDANGARAELKRLAIREPERCLACGVGSHAQKLIARTKPISRRAIRVRTTGLKKSYAKKGRPHLEPGRRKTKPNVRFNSNLSDGVGGLRPIRREGSPRSARRWAPAGWPATRRRNC